MHKHEHENNKKQGNSAHCLYGIGVGPGDPELLTVKGYRLLQECPVIAYPESKKGEGGYALSIVEGLFDERKKLLPLWFPMTKEKDKLTQSWNDAADLVLEYLEKGDVAFITEGDPFFYSTFIHLMNVVKNKKPEIRSVAVPGVSSVFGSASSLGVPLSDGDERLLIAPATQDMELMREYIMQNDTVVFLKVAKVLTPMIQLLKDLNLHKQAYVAVKATSSEEKLIHNIEEINNQDINYLSLMIVKSAIGDKNDGGKNNG